MADFEASKESSFQITEGKLRRLSGSISEPAISRQSMPVMMSLSESARILPSVSDIAEMQIDPNPRDPRRKSGGAWFSIEETQIKVKILDKVHGKKGKVSFDVEFEETKGKHKKGETMRFSEQEEDGPSRSVEKAYENPDKFDCYLKLSKTDEILGSKNPPKK